MKHFLSTSVLKCFFLCSSVLKVWRHGHTTTIVFKHITIMISEKEVNYVYTYYQLGTVLFEMQIMLFTCSN